MPRIKSLLLAGLLPALLTEPGIAADNWDLCHVPQFVFSADADLETDETRVEAQTIASEDSDRIHFVGAVSVNRSDQRIRSDELFIDKTTREIRAQGNVVFESSEYRLQSPAIRIDDDNERASFERPEFELRDRHARGKAELIEKLDADRSRYRNLEYTSCDPGDRSWHLAAESLEIDDASGRGTAKHTTLYLSELPVFYLPWFQFPIDDRRMSGLLSPRFGYDDDSGTTLVLPVYWNIAPNYDMTITPAWYGKRGLQLNTENRYLTRLHRGQLDLSYLDDDREIDDSRWYQRWQHDSSLGFDLQADWLLAEVSDGEFFDDFESIAPVYNDTRHLESFVRLQRPFESWQSELLWQDYQTLDETTAVVNRPYRRLPRLGVDGEFESSVDNLSLPLAIEWVNFERDDSVTGERSHVVSSLGYRAQQSWYFLEPKLQLAFTDYRLDNNPADNRIDRALPTLSIDSGIILERDAGSRGQWLQTLEPRLYFLHTPFEDQDEIPDFDTSLRASTYDNFFRNNRFIGADRIGDANQVTLGIASRVFARDSGNQLMHARVGQIHYFKDRRVSLDGQRDEASRSDLITEMDWWPQPELKFATRLVYDEDLGDLKQKDLSINYADQGFAANFGYYFTEDQLEQALVSLVYPVNERWTLVAKLHRSLRFEQPVDNLFGINYESCCWGLKILAGQSGDEIDNFAETDNRIYFEVTLKGLSSAGRDIDAQLQKAIPGYRSRF